MKLKTRKSAVKRVKIKKSGYARKKAYKGHLLRRKNSKRLRRLNAPAVVHSVDASAFSTMIPYK